MVDALESGVQRLILRKGGIAEGRGGFRPENQRFLLFPTLFHQQRDQVIPLAQDRYDAISAGLADAETVRISSWVEVISWQKLETLAEAQKLRGQHIWRDEVIAERFSWGREESIYALFLQVYVLPRAQVVPMLPVYGGCKSWIELAEDISLEGSVAIPYVGDAQFSQPSNRTPT